MSGNRFRLLGSNPLARQAAALAVVVIAVTALSGWVMRRGLTTSAQAAIIDPQPAGRGQDLFVQTCASCHGKSAQGLPHQGVNLQRSTFVSRQPDGQLLKFLRTGRTPDDKAT